MTPSEAAKAFYGQDAKTFAEMIERLTINDPRLEKIFHNTRARVNQADG